MKTIAKAKKNTKKVPKRVLSSSVSFRIESKLNKELDKYSAILNITKSAMIQQAVSEYIYWEKKREEGLQISRQQAKDGIFATEEEVNALLSKYLNHEN